MSDFHIWKLASQRIFQFAVFGALTEALVDIFFFFMTDEAISKKYVIFNITPSALIAWNDGNRF